MTKNDTIETERIHSLKFIHSCLEVCPQLLPRSLTSAVVAISLNSEDPLRVVCIQTLGRIGK